MGHLFFFWRKTLVALVMASMRILEMHWGVSSEGRRQQRRTAGVAFPEEHRVPDISTIWFCGGNKPNKMRNRIRNLEFCVSNSSTFPPHTLLWDALGFTLWTHLLCRTDSLVQFRQGAAFVNKLFERKPNREPKRKSHCWYVCTHV